MRMEDLQQTIERVKGGGGGGGGLRRLGGEGTTRLLGEETSDAGRGRGRAEGGSVSQEDGGRGGRGGGGECGGTGCHGRGSLGVGMDETSDGATTEVDEGVHLGALGVAVCDACCGVDTTKKAARG